MQAMERLQEHLFLSTLSLRRATVYTCPIISTIIHFYPRSPCGERPGRMTENGTKKLTFLSTLSLRRATCYSFRHSASCWYFYPRSPCGERQRLWIMLYSCPGNFYPRSPCGERLAGVNSMLTLIQFLSTLSLRRATTQYFTALHNILISIHALLAESDRSRPHWAWRGSISIHALLAESDPGIQRLVALLRQFLSTLSLRRAT